MYEVRKIKYKVFAQGILSTNCTLLQKDRACVIVDVPYDALDLISFVKEHNLILQAVLLTHGHFDHCGGVSQLFEMLGCSAPVFVNARDVKLCETAAENVWGAPAQNCIPTNFVSEVGFCVGDWQFGVVETPGHTAGSVCYIAEDLLLSGDTLMKGTIGRTDFAESVPDEMYCSLEKLRKLEGDFTVVPGHGGLTTLSCEKANNPFLSKRTGKILL